jgi:hypothetical protein
MLGRRGERGGVVIRAVTFLDTPLGATAALGSDPALCWLQVFDAFGTKTFAAP